MKTTLENKFAAKAVQSPSGTSKNPSAAPNGNDSRFRRREFAALNPPAVHHPNPFFTPAELAARWRWHVETIRLWLRQRRLASVIISRRRLIPVAEVERVEKSGLVQRD